MNDAPIGIFDSGVGGLTVARAVLDQPAVRRAVAATRNGRIGVIGTSATIGSRAYDDAFAAAPSLELTSAACPRFVEYVERGEVNGDDILDVAADYLAPVRDAGVDTLVLGCTHYPMLTGAIRYVMGPEVTLVSSAEETALDVYRQLTAAGIERTDPSPPAHVFAETATAAGSSSMFARLSRRFLGPAVTMTSTLPVVTP